MKHKQLTFSLFDFDIWLGREWEVTLTLVQVGQRSLFQIGCRKNYRTQINIFFINSVNKSIKEIE